MTLRDLEYEVHVAGHSDARRDLHATIQHAQQRAELRVLNNAERVVARRDPHDEVVPKLRLRVGRPRGERGDVLGLHRRCRRARADVAEEVAGRVLVNDAVQVRGVVAVNGVSVSPCCAAAECEYIRLANEAAKSIATVVRHNLGVLEVGVGVGAPLLGHSS